MVEAGPYARKPHHPTVNGVGEQLNDKLAVRRKPGPIFIAVRDLAMRFERRRRALRMGRGFRMDFVWLDVAERLTRNGRYVLVSLSPPIACVTHLREAATLRCVPRAGEGADRL